MAQTSKGCCFIDTMEVLRRNREASRILRERSITHHDLLTNSSNVLKQLHECFTVDEWKFVYPALIVFATLYQIRYKNLETLRETEIPVFGNIQIKGELLKSDILELILYDKDEQEHMKMLENIGAYLANTKFFLNCTEPSEDFIVIISLAELKITKVFALYNGFRKETESLECDIFTNFKDAKKVIGLWFLKNRSCRLKGVFIDNILHVHGSLEEFYYASFSDWIGFLETVFPDLRDLWIIIGAVIDRANDLSPLYMLSEVAIIQTLNDDMRHNFVRVVSFLSRSKSSMIDIPLGVNAKRLPCINCLESSDEDK